MHYGRIDRNTAAGRVYRVLRHAAEHGGGWVSGWDLTLQARTSAVGTRVSEVRAQLPPGESVEVESRRRNGQQEFFYRLVSGRGGSRDGRG